MRALKQSLPEGEFFRSEALDEYFSPPHWSVEAWLVPDEGKVVLLIIGSDSQ